MPALVILYACVGVLACSGVREMEPSVDELDVRSAGNVRVEWETKRSHVDDLLVLAAF